MGGNRCNYRYKSIDGNNIEIEAFMFGQEPYPKWFRIAMYESHTVRVHYKKTKKRTMPLFVDLNTNDTISMRAYPYDMIIINLVPNKLVSMSYEVFERLFVNI